MEGTGASLLNPVTTANLPLGVVCHISTALGMTESPVHCTPTADLVFLVEGSEATALVLTAGGWHYPVVAACRIPGNIQHILLKPVIPV